MNQQMKKYADWLVANQNKKGTPEWDTVSNAYKELRSQGTVAAQQPSGPSSNPLVGAGKRSLQLGANFTNSVSLIGDKIDEALDLPYVKFGNDDGQFQLSDLKPSLVPRQGNQDKELFTQAEQFLQGAADDVDYQANVSWDEVKANPNAKNILTFMGESAVTSTPDMVASLVSAPAYFTSYIAPIAEERAKNDGRDTVSNQDILIAMTSAAGIAAAERFGAKGIFGGATGNAGKRIAQAGAKETVTEAVQNPIEYAGGTLGTEAGFDVAEAADQSLAGAVGGFGTGVGLRTAREVTGAGSADNRQAMADAALAAGDVLNPDMIGYDREAAADLAQRLQRIAKSNKHNLNNIKKSSTSGAREVLDKAHLQMKTELQQLAKDLKSRLKIKDSDSRNVVLDKVLAIAGQVEARNKAKSTVGVEEMRAIESLAGDTKEGQEMLALMRQMNELTTLHNEGYVAGVSQYTDQLSPIPTNVGYSDRSLIETPTRVLGSLYGASINPIIPIAQAGAVVSGRVIDKATGRRSRVAKYVRDNAKNSGINTSTNPSLRENARIATLQKQAQKAKTAAEDRDMHEQIYKDNGTFSPLSPQQSIMDELGISPQNAVAILEEVAKNPAFANAANKAINSFKKGGPVPNMKYIVPRMKAVLNDPNNSLQSDRQAVAGAVDAHLANSGENPNYQRGIDDNRKLADELAAQVNEDTDIVPADKAILIYSLKELRQNLGKNPGDRALDILAEAESDLNDPSLVQRYLEPYLDRIIKQQNGKAPKTIVNQMVNPEQDLNAPKLTFGEGTDVMAKTVNARMLQNALEKYVGITPTNGALSFKDRVDFKNIQDVLENGAAKLDQQGRDDISKVQVGLEGRGISNEELLRVLPDLVDTFEFITGDYARIGRMGSYEETYTNDVLSRRQINVVKTGENIASIANPQKIEMTLPQFYDTFMHELGHAIEHQSGLRDFIEQTQFGDAYNEKEGQISKSLREVSKNQRADIFKMVEDKWLRLKTNIQTPLPNFSELPVNDMTDGKVWKMAEQAAAIDLMNRGELGLANNVSKEIKEIRRLHEYIHSAPELGADAIAAYMAKPELLKKKHPELAEAIKKVVNRSDLKKFITFHSIAGLLGTSAMAALLLGLEDNEEMRGILSGQQGALSIT